jgi:hypothetical protein
LSSLIRENRKFVCRRVKSSIACAPLERLISTFMRKLSLARHHSRDRCQRGRIRHVQFFAGKNISSKERRKNWRKFDFSNCFEYERSKVSLSPFFSCEFFAACFGGKRSPIFAPACDHHDLDKAGFNHRILSSLQQIPADVGHHAIAVIRQAPGKLVVFADAEIRARQRGKSNYKSFKLGARSWRLANQVADRWVGI